MPTPGMPSMGMPGMLTRACSPTTRTAPRSSTLTRTDFLIQFVWQPPKPEERLKPEELTAKVADVTKQMRDAQKNSTEVVIKEADLEALSKAASREVETGSEQDRRATGTGSAAGTGNRTAAGGPGQVI